MSNPTGYLAHMTDDVHADAFLADVPDPDEVTEAARAAADMAEVR